MEDIEQRIQDAVDKKIYDMEKEMAFWREHGKLWKEVSKSLRELVKLYEEKGHEYENVER